MATQKKWDDTFFVRIYQLALSGLPESQIAASLGVNKNTFFSWKRSKKGVRYALQQANKKRDKTGCATFGEYVFQRLSPDLQELWAKIQICETNPSGIVQIEAMLQNAGKDARMHLFLYALVHHAFNASQACRSVNISKKTLDVWIEKEPGFSDLIKEIHWHKKNFYEGSLVELVNMKDSPATIFVNRTFNKDRGYGESTKVDVNVTGSIEHLVNIDELQLPIETRKQILNAIRAKKTTQLLENKKDTIVDADFIINNGSKSSKEPARKINGHDSAE